MLFEEERTCHSNQLIRRGRCTRKHYGVEDMRVRDKPIMKD